jgi:hypothetical protein
MKSCLILYDNLIVDDEFYRQRLLDITEFYIKNLIDQFTTKNVTQQLIECAKLGYKWAIVNAIGHCISDPAFYRRAIDQCQEEGTPLMCHILDRYIGGGGQYPEFDPQCFVINLEAWTQVGQPQLEIQSGQYQIEALEFLRSFDNYHDNYTPHWIRPGPGMVEYRGPYRGFGSLVLQAFIEHNCKIINFDRELRRIKSYLYPNKSSEHLIPFFQDGTITFDLETNLELWPLAIVIKLYQDMTNAIYILNTEPIFSATPIFPKQPLDHIVGVAAGFKTVLLLNRMGFHDQTQVTYIDISEPALDYQRYLIQHWNGDFEVYPHILKNYQELHPELDQEFNFFWRNWNSWEDEIKNFLEESGLTGTEFYDLWNQYRTLRHHYIKIDLLDTTQYHILTNHVRNSQLTYIWLSNAFDMEYIRFYHGSKYSQHIFDHLIDCLTNSDQRYYVETNGRVTTIKLVDSTVSFYNQHYNEHGYVYPSIPAEIQKTHSEKFEWILNQSRIPYLELDIDGPWDKILQEVQQLDHLFVPHRGSDSRGWTSLCLHGISSTHTDSHTQYEEYQDLPGDQVPYSWTDISELCPTATEYFQTKFPFGQYYRLRFMRIAPGGFISPHNDSTTWQPNAINISLNNPKECGMVLGNVGLVPFRDTGGVMLLNTSYTHTVWNRSNQARYHIIAHGVWDGSLGQKIVAGYEKKLKTQVDKV